MVHTPAWLAATMRELRYSIRVLVSRGNRHTTLFSIAVLAVAIGTAVTVLTIASALLFRAFPYPAASRLMSVRLIYHDREGTEPTTRVATWGLFNEWRHDNLAFELLGAHQTADLTFTERELDPVRVPTVAVTSSMFTLLGGIPVLGRTLVPGDDRQGNSRVVVLSHAFWTTHYGSDADVVGRSLTLNGVRYQIVGVMAPSFRVPISIPEASKHEAEVWIPLSTRVGDRDQAQATPVEIIGRLRGGVSPARASKQLESYRDVVAVGGPEGMQVQVMQLKDVVTAQVRKPIMILLGAVALLLLVACLNMANLRLANSINRNRDLALRLALGAQRLTIVMQLFVESLVLTVLGGSGGVLLAYWFTPLVVRFGDRHLPEVGPIAVNVTGLVGGVVIASLVALAITAGPATYAVSMPSTAALRGRGDSPRQGQVRRIVSDVLVVTQIGFALILAAATGLLTRSLHNLTDRDRGYDSADLLVAALRLPPGQYSTSESQRAFAGQILDRAGALPGVTRVAVATGGPVVGGASGDVTAGNQTIRMATWAVSPGFFRVLGISLRTGRLLQGATESNPVVVDASAAQQLFGTEDPIGARVTWSGGSGSGVVIGVVGDIDEYYINDDNAHFRATEPHLYVPFRNEPRP